MTDPRLLSQITDDMVRDLGIAQGACIRPVLQRVTDHEDGTSQVVALPCGSTRESQCPSCARKARLLRMQQCAEGWHRTEEPEPTDTGSITEAAGSNGSQTDTGGIAEDADTAGTTRRVRSTRRRSDAPDLPRVPMEQRTVGTTFVARDGREYRPSMFVTLTLPSYGPVIPGVGTPADPSTYNYRRAALDALMFPRLVDQFWKALRRCAGYNVQYFSAIEPQKRLAPHLHAAIRGAIPRATLRQVAKAVYLQVWWPPINHVVYDSAVPVWTPLGYADPTTGELLPTWDQALDALEEPGAKPMHVMRFGSQVDAQGIVAPSPDADRAVRYLTKYLTKSVAETCGNELTAAQTAHIDRLHRELRYLPCNERCANWLRYGVQPKDAGPSLVPGHCQHKAHDREMLGLGGRRVLVSRKWSGKTLQQHRADRQAVVQAVLEEAGFTAPEIDRLAADTQMDDGARRFTWENEPRKAHAYRLVMLESIRQRQEWRRSYHLAKGRIGLAEDQSPAPPPWASPQPSLPTSPVLQGAS